MTIEEQIKVAEMIAALDGQETELIEGCHWKGECDFFYKIDPRSTKVVYIIKEKKFKIRVPCSNDIQAYLLDGWKSIEGETE